MINMKLLIVFILCLPIFSSVLARDAVDTKIFNCNSKFSAEDCYEIGLEYKEKKQASQSNKYLNKACMLKHQKACDLLNSKEEVEKKEIDPSYQTFLDSLDISMCHKLTFLKSVYTVKDLSTDDSKDYCFKHGAKLYTQCSFTKKNLKKLRETTYSFHDFTRFVSRYKKLGVCKKITPE